LWQVSSFRSLEPSARKPQGKNPSAIRETHHPLVRNIAKSSLHLFSFTTPGPEEKKNNTKTSVRGGGISEEGGRKRPPREMATMQSWRKAYGAIKDTTTVSLANLNSDFKVRRRSTNSSPVSPGFILFFFCAPKVVVEFIQTLAVPGRGSGLGSVGSDCCPPAFFL
jgi:hypothetical protein